jgi:hypothetical protein
MKAGETRDPDIHLARGAHAVRSWSHYKTTVAGWSVCGIQKPLRVTERPGAVTCKFCLHLMGRKEKDQT